MRRATTVLVIALLAVAVGHSSSPVTDWKFNATAIEACSCPMFCQCYFNPEPAAHHDHGGKHFCEFNMAYKVNKGHHGSVDLTGMKFWITGDLGSHFGSGETDWAIVTFDKKSTPQQREALGAILPQVFPVKWKSFKTAEGDIDLWQADKDSAHAKLNGGRTAEIKLVRHQGNTDEPVVVQNLKYFAAPRNDGFVLMPNQLNAYRGEGKTFEWKDRNGFMITIDMNSADVKQ